MSGRLFWAPAVVDITGPLIFLAGPIKGATRWQDDAVEYIWSLDDSIHIASPRRPMTTLTADKKHQKFTPEMFNEQVDWETKYLNRAAAMNLDSSEKGVVLFWLAKESVHLCERAYAQTTRFELAEWKEKYLEFGVMIAVGIEEGFSGAHYIRRRMLQDCPEIPIRDTLEETCRDAVALITQG
jgi:hypothetical protein